jgi:demethylmenaquinone methyltransferase/2-methoxy-6-polyprenyl-1,4-benzoquinol methylase
MRFKLKNDPAVLSRPGAKRDYNRLLFAEVAPKYHTITRLMSFFRDASWKRRLIDGLPVAIDGPVLDIATGTGDLLKLAARRWPGANLVGCDLSLTMLSLARRAIGVDKIRLSCQDMSSLAVRAGSIAVVTGGYALRNAPDVRTTLIECLRVLKPGGTTAFLDFSRSPSRAGFAVSYWTLRFWGGLWGLFMHGNPAVYAYIAESLRLFPNRTRLRAMLADIGFVNIAAYSKMFGLIEIIIARKAA